MKAFPYLPEEDGITHINVYSKGVTELGRFLSNFADTPFHHPEDGYFKSVEGYWYWLGCKDDRLRQLSGFSAKDLGRKIGAPDWINDEDFKRKIGEAIEIKLKGHPKMIDLLVRNKLPLTHYYCNIRSIIPVPRAEWILDKIRSIRESFIESGRCPGCEPDYECWECWARSNGREVLGDE